MKAAIFLDEFLLDSSRVPRPLLPVWLLPARGGRPRVASRRQARGALTKGDRPPGRADRSQESRGREGRPVAPGLGEYRRGRRQPDFTYLTPAQGAGRRQPGRVHRDHSKAGVPVCRPGPGHFAAWRPGERENHAGRAAVQESRRRRDARLLQRRPDRGDDRPGRPAKPGAARGDCAHVGHALRGNDEIGSADRP